MQYSGPKEERQPEPNPIPGENVEGWSEEGRRWYEELLDHEGSLAPWLNWEWTGDQMKARRS